MNCLYLHIPFCIKKCNYCSFVSFCAQENDFEEYFSALKKELDFKSPKSLDTLYIGGGTPSCVPVEYYKKLHFDFAPEYEFTFEVNPGTVDKAYLSALRDIGVNRLSIGVQSFDDKILKTIGRIHNAKQAIECVEMAQDAGFENISVDLIYGLPNQTMDAWKSSLASVLRLGVQHLSTYGLKIEAGTPFSLKTPQGLPSEDCCADMYLECVKTLSEAGFRHYEISNFALPGYESRHNSNYWQNNPYIACGVAAHGYENGIRYENTQDFKEYLKNPLSPLKSTTLSQEDFIEEAIFLGLRMKDGIDTKSFKQRYGVDFEEEYAAQLKKYSDFFEHNQGRISLTTEGFMLSNYILADFV